jgi:hypothetical protein
LPGCAADGPRPPTADAQQRGVARFGYLGYAFAGPQPPFHHAPAHLERTGVGLAQQRVGLGGIAPEQQTAPAADADRHVAADQERQPAEHALLGDIGPGRDQLTNAVGEILVVGHR